jgi:CRP/FNR family cyclic AMP-dependent transcriptional regulator
MDTTAFFNYPTLAGATPPEPAPVPGAADPGFLSEATVEEWDAVLAATETLRFHPGDVVLRAGERDRAFYLLLDGRLETARGATPVAAPAALGVAAFVDAQPRAVALIARTHGELARMSWDAYEALAARDPMLGRAILVDLARGLAGRLRTAGASLPGWTG